MKIQQVITFKLLTEDDLLLLYDWFQKPHIQQWYARGERYTLDMIKEKYLPRILKPMSIPNYIVSLNHRPIAYIQLYCVKDYLPDGITDDHHPFFANLELNKVYGIDMFIADENHLNKGYGTLILSHFIKEHVKNKFTHLVTDPLKTNKNAIHFFEKNGFKKNSPHPSQSANELLVLHIT